MIILLMLHTHPQLLIALQRPVDMKILEAPLAKQVSYDLIKNSVQGQLKIRQIYLYTYSRNSGWGVSQPLSYHPGYHGSP